MKNKTDIWSPCKDKVKVRDTGEKPISKNNRIFIFKHILIL